MQGLVSSLEGLSVDLRAQASLPKYTLSSERPLRTNQRVLSSYSISNRYSIQLALVLSTLGTRGWPQTILRMTDTPISTLCHPCVFFIPQASGEAKLLMRHSGFGWYSDIEISIPTPTVTTTLFLDVSLVDKVQRFRVYRGTSSSGSDLISSKYNVHTGPYHPPSEHFMYLSSTAGGAKPAVGFYDAATLVVSHTLMNAARAAFSVTPYSTLPLRNFVVHNSSSPTLLEDASTLTAYSGMYTSATVLSASGPRPGVGSACFNGEAALIHNTVDDSLVLDGITNKGLTTCLWFNRSGEFDTLFPTLFDGSGQIRMFAFFADVSYNPHGLFQTDVRASPPSLAVALENAWTNVCATSEVDKPARLYINGSLVSEETTPSVMAGIPAQRPISLGGSSDVSLHTGYGVDRGVRACVSDVLVWGRALSESEVSTVHKEYASSLWAM